MEASDTCENVLVPSALSYQDSSPPDSPHPRKLTADDILNFIGLGPFQFIAFLLAGLTFLVYGMDVSVFIFIGEEVEEQFNLTSIEYAIFPAVTAVPNMVGAFFFSILSDKYGRVWPYALALAVIGVFGVASAFAPTYLALILIRAPASIGVGGIPILTFPTFVEYLPVRNRGKASILVLLLPALGLCIASGFAWWLLPTYPKNGWRYFTIVIMLPTLLIAVFRLVFYVQSPRFLVAKGRYDKAWDVFALMAKVNGKDLSDFVSKDEFYTSLCVDTKKQNSQRLMKQFLTILKPPLLRRTVLLSIAIVMVSLGFQGSTLFLPQVLEKLGVNAYFATFSAFLSQIPGVLFMAIISEWPFFGRLNSMRLFSIIIVIFFALFSVFTVIHTPAGIAVSIEILYFCMLPLYGLMYIYIAESYPTSIRVVTTAYFYYIQGVTSLFFPFLSGYLASSSLPWLYPAVWASLFLVHLLTALGLDYEPYGKKLVDLTL